MKAHPPTPQGKDQQVTGFSDCSRRRLRKKLHA
ncbi:hypothetical protein GGP92_003298, partial [Salinibacter ruber]|nr:hypothetical protein [Salinibacter ruber]